MLYEGWSPRNPWPVDRLKAFKSFLKALKAQAGVIHRGDLGLKSAPFQSLHAPLAARMAWGQCKGVSLLHGAGFALRASLACRSAQGLAPEFRVIRIFELVAFPLLRDSALNAKDTSECLRTPTVVAQERLTLAWAR